jgi:hypothetical protein
MTTGQISKSLNYDIFLSRLYTDGFFRHLFFQNPSLLLNGFGLTKEEEKSLLNLDAESIDHLTSALLKKAHRATQDAFPALFRLFESEMTDLFFQGYSIVRKAPQDSSHAYCMRMGYFFLETMPSKNLPDYCMDLAAFYVAKLEAKLQALPAFTIQSEQPQPHGHPFLYPNLQVHTFSCELENLLDEEMDLTSIPKNPHYYLIFYREREFQLLKLSTPTARLLKLCNGVYDLQTIWERLNKTFNIEIDQLLNQIIPQLIKNQIVYIK